MIVTRDLQFTNIWNEFLFAVNFFPRQLINDHGGVDRSHPPSPPPAPGKQRGVIHIESAAVLMPLCRPRSWSIFFVAGIFCSG